MQVEEAVEARYVPLEDEEQLTEASVAALQDNGKSSSHSKNTGGNCLRQTDSFKFLSVDSQKKHISLST